MAAATKIVTRLPVDFCSLKFGAGVRSAPKLKSQVVAQKRYDTQTKEHLTNIIRLHRLVQKGIIAKIHFTFRPSIFHFKFVYNNSQEQ